VSKQINITNGVFDSVEIEQSDDVFWQNNDSFAHWPVPWCSGLKTEPGQPSSAFQTFPGASPLLPQVLQYTCALHPKENGTIYIYNDFLLVTLPLTGTAGQTATVALATGGKSPYNIKIGAAPAWLSVTETTPVDSSAGISATFTNPPAGSYTFNLNVTDGLGKNFQQQIGITIS
jgi:hypothetical protein